MKRYGLLFVSMLVVMSMLLAACAPAATPAAPAAAEPTQAPEANPQPAAPEPTQAPAEPAAPEATAAPAPTATLDPNTNLAGDTEVIAGRTQVTWFIGIGAGAKPESIVMEREFIEKYNASQDKIQVVPIIIDNNYARDNLTAQLAAGNAPDIVGPIGTAGRAAFPGAFLDLEPLIKEANYDTSDIDPNFLSFYKDEGKLVGLPFAIFPEFAYVNKDLFEEAGLALPPQKYGEKYTLDGKQVDWDFDTLTEISKRLTVDKNGNDATSPDFDAENIVQYGYDPQWTDNARAVGSLFAPFYPVDDKGNATIPETTKDAWKWFYEGMWGEQPFIPNQAAIDSTLLNTNAFSSGKVAIGTTHLWYTCCIDVKNVPNLDIAVMPSYKGKVTSKMHGDTFAIMAASKHPKEAFEVYTYLLGEGSADLYKIYGGLPARKSQQQAFFKDLDTRFAPNVINWQVALDSIQYMDVPNHELGMPNNSKANDLFQSLGSDLRSNPELNFDERIAKFISDLDVIFKEK